MRSNSLIVFLIAFHVLVLLTVFVGLSTTYYFRNRQEASIQIPYYPFTMALICLMGVDLFVGGLYIRHLVKEHKVKDVLLAQQDEQLAYYEEYYLNLKPPEKVNG